MPDAELLSRFRSCLRYREAKRWQKPLLNPRRFISNQLRKHRVGSLPAGTLEKISTFHLAQFTVVRGELVSQELTSYSLFEPDLTEAFLHLVEPGQVVLDIGMHLGYYATLFAVLVGKQGEVHAFEPTPSTREIARHNTGPFPQIQVHPVAVWSSHGTLVLHDYGVKWMGFNSLVGAKLDEEPAPPQEIKVQTITLDQFRASLDAQKKIALLKIDAESAERDIIAGGKVFIQEDRPLISVEVGDQKDSRQSRSLTEDLIGLGYEPWEFKSGRFCRHHTRHTYAYGNLIFAPRGRRLDQAA